MALRSKLRPARRSIPLATALEVVPVSNLALAHKPHGDGITLVNPDREFMERRKSGEFVARPLFDCDLQGLFCGVRHASQPTTGTL